MKILLYDIETSPIIGYVWKTWQTDVSKIKKDWEVLTVSYKWLGQNRVYGKTRLDFKNEEAMVKHVWSLFEEADLLIAHNGNSFDQKKMNAKFIQYRLGPPAPYCQIDTKLEAKRNAKFTSNSLDKLCERLGLGRKLALEGIELWDKCMSGSKAAYKTMLRYNKQDVKMLEQLYLELRPWIKNHPHVNRKDRSCPNCGSNRLHSKGLLHTKTLSYRRFTCKDCGAHSKARLAEKNTPKPEIV